VLEANRQCVNKKIAGEAKPFYASSTPITIDGAFIQFNGSHLLEFVKPRSDWMLGYRVSCDGPSAHGSEGKDMARD
jgi:hypothetical protein